MDGREIESRMLMWAVAEISWEDASGQHCQASAVLEDRSNSGACVRLTRPVAVGSVVTIRWQREQFSAVARNCRRDGREFVIGVRREAESGSPSRNSASRALAPVATAKVPQPSPPRNDHPLLLALHGGTGAQARPTDGHADGDYQHCACLICAESADSELRRDRRAD